jgi:hypothetical protein
MMTDNDGMNMENTIIKYNLNNVFRDLKYAHLYSR